ncbi:hypothetical protein BK662_03245 [Pseudomonas frederiksbergensis]|uniref:Uncharacterized protein n=1 Tax=Pseudomonas frederiksbergensis TaxID=104087 RepID=A0A423I1D5_9PSED|nr:hypothetical protein BK662_03245 [Pseudomonas frederiksbergensis]
MAGFAGNLYGPELADVFFEVFFQSLSGANSLELLQQLPFLVKQHGRCSGDFRMLGRFAGVEHVDLRVVPIRFGNLTKNRPAAMVGRVDIELIGISFSKISEGLSTLKEVSRWVYCQKLQGASASF